MHNTIVSVEISMYPLQDNYLQAVDAFIISLYKYPTLRVHTSHLSTMVIGPYGDVMDALKDEIFQSYQKNGQASFVLKVLAGDAEKEVNIESYR
jgi:uncharacterized protein YqgV (UPF0045/DUF77 family)